MDIDTPAQPFCAALSLSLMLLAARVGDREDQRDPNADADKHHSDAAEQEQIDDHDGLARLSAATANQTISGSANKAPPITKPASASEAPNQYFTEMPAHIAPETQQ